MVNPDNFRTLWHRNGIGQLWRTDEGIWTQQLSMRSSYPPLALHGIANSMALCECVTGTKSALLSASVTHAPHTDTV